MARIGQPITLTMEEKQELLTMSRSHKLEKRYVERALIILLSAECKSLDKIVESTGKSKPLSTNGGNVLEKTGSKASKIRPGAVSLKP
jgi:transposase